ncbi:MAG: hypothetical protein JXA52_02315 [Planctomycetes bacterium]|nr:hypothetical protein [Planctomycetota bacterium]
MPKRILSALVMATVLLLVTGMALPQGATLLETYGSIPKGIVLEGAGESMEEITEAVYNREENKFLLNQKYAYRLPVELKEFAIILEAISQDDRLGISYTTTKDFITFGKLSDRTVVARNLLKADLFLGGVVYGIQRQIGKQELPENYEPVVVGLEEIKTAVCFSFVDYIFTLDPKSLEYTAFAPTMHITVVPLSKKHAADGGNLPDLELLEKGEGFGKSFGVECQPNVEHILANREEYFKLPVVATAVRYGEAAAFARRLRDSGIDLAELLKTL